VSFFLVRPAKLASFQMKGYADLPAFVNT